MLVGRVSNSILSLDWHRCSWERRIIPKRWYCGPYDLCKQVRQRFCGDAPILAKLIWEHTWSSSDLTSDGTVLQGVEAGSSWNIWRRVTRLYICAGCSSGSIHSHHSCRSKSRPKQPKSLAISGPVALKEQIWNGKITVPQCEHRYHFYWKFKKTTNCSAKLSFVKAYCKVKSTAFYWASCENDSPTWLELRESWERFTYKAGVGQDEQKKSKKCRALHKASINVWCML